MDFHNRKKATICSQLLSNMLLIYCVQGHCLNMGSRLFGRCWHAGDVVGCMINMEDKSMIFTLNGEILITTKGSELCFTDFETEDGEEMSHYRVLD